MDETKSRDNNVVNNMEINENDNKIIEDGCTVNEKLASIESVESNHLTVQDHVEAGLNTQKLSSDIHTEEERKNEEITSELGTISNASSVQLKNCAENDDVKDIENDTTNKAVIDLCHGNDKLHDISPDQGEGSFTAACSRSEECREVLGVTSDNNNNNTDIINYTKDVDEQKDNSKSKKQQMVTKDNFDNSVRDIDYPSKLKIGSEKLIKDDAQLEKRAQPTSKKLPEWFKMMIGLTHGIHEGKEMEHWEDIGESIDIHGSTQASTVKTNARLVQLLMKKISRITRRDRQSCLCLPNFGNLKKTFQSQSTIELNSIVEDLLDPLAEIDNVNISCEGVRAPCHTGCSTLLHIRCTSCQSLYKVVAILNSPLFKDGIVRIKECLEEEMHDKLDIAANITPGSMQDVKTHLREQGILKGTDDFVCCPAHPGKLNEVYCFEHGDICCKTCMQSQHSCCHDVTQVTKGDPVKRNLPSLKRKVKEHSVRIYSGKSDEGNCDIIAGCALPQERTILADMNNKRLRILNKELKVIQFCDLPDCPRDVCYTGNNRVAVILYDHSIQFVDISGTPELKEKVDLDHDGFGVACCGRKLYVTDALSVYTYSLEGKEEGRLYRQLAGNHRFCKAVISEDKHKMYIAAREGGLVTVDLNGNHLHTLCGRELGIVSDVCVVDDGSLIVCNARTQTVSRVDSEGKTIIEKVAGRSEDMYMPQSLCYDKHSNRLLVGHLHDDYISVLKIN